MVSDSIITKFGTVSMSLWNDPERWAALCSGRACPICSRGAPLDVVATLGSGWVTMQKAAPVRGYACLVSRSHVIELHDLSEPDALAFMRDARKVSKALCDITGAVKLNYEIHGNSVPHLHMHFFPRYPGDQFEGQPINPRQVTSPVYAEGEFERIRSMFLAGLDGTR
jgi:diadenosine tetraphosphate (Ap4A) HIT family hydrolase